MNFRDMLASIPNSGTPGSLSSATTTFCQSREFFNLALAKAARVERLREVFQSGSIRKVVLTSNLRDFDCELEGVVTEYLPGDFFSTLTIGDLPALRKRLEGCVVVVNNNDAARNLPAYVELYSQCTETVFAVWDWDNHHWLDLSTVLAATCDVYAPSHHENLYLLTRYNWLTIGPVYCASVQWSRKTLAESLPEMLRAERSNAPLGRHIPYSGFDFRNQVLVTLSSVYPTIGFSDRGFHGRSPEDRLQEWVRHKIHWIAPVLNDVPIRVFDALITGGIPLVPQSMRYLQPLCQIPDTSIVSYSSRDILNPREVVERAIALFNAEGFEGIAKRHVYAMKYHHGDRAIRTILDMIRGNITEIAGGRRTD